MNKFPKNHCFSHRIRLFVSLPLPEPFLNYLIREQKKQQKFFQKHNAKIRWVQPKNFHITLYFIGETEEKNLKPIIAGLKQETRFFPPLKLTFQKINFAPPENPRMIWGFFAPNQKFSQLSFNMRKILKNFCFKNFYFSSSLPHVTLGRFSSLPKISSNFNGIFNDSSIRYSQIKINNCQLMQSHLTPQGAQYSLIKTFNFYKNI